MADGTAGIFGGAMSRLRSLWGGGGVGSRPRPEAFPGSAAVTPYVPAPAPYPVNLTGEVVDERNVLSVTAAWAAVNAIATDVSTLPLRLRRRLPDGSVAPVADHPVSRLFSRSPDGGETTPVTFWRAMLFHLLVRGNAYARIDREGGIPTRLYVLDPTRISPFRAADGGVAYCVVGEAAPLLPDRVLHLAGLGGDGVTGYSPTRFGGQTLGLSRAAESHAATFFGNNAEMRGFFTTQSGTAEKLEEFRRSVREMFSGARRHAPGVFGPGTTFQKTGGDPAETQLLGLREFQILEAARIWRIAPHKLADFSKASYASVEQSNLAHATETLRPICESIEAAMDLRLLTDSEAEAGLFWEFDLAAYLRADTAARSAWIKNMAGAGMLTIDEGRAIEGLPPLPDGLGRRPMVPLNTAPLDKVAGQAVAEEPPK